MWILKKYLEKTDQSRVEIHWKCRPKAVGAFMSVKLRIYFTLHFLMCQLSMLMFSWILIGGVYRACINE